MATNKISGRVALDDSDLGIPNILVAIYDLDPNTAPEEQIPGRTLVATRTATGLDNGLGGLGDRLGSVLTGIDGSFELPYEDDEFRIRNEKEKRPDLQLLIFAPESPGKTLNDLVMFASPIVRQGAGRLEGYFVRFSADQLAKFGLPVPEKAAPEPADDSGDADLAALEQKLKAGQSFYDRRAAIFRQNVDQQHAEHVKVRSATFSANLKQSLSRLPEAIRNSPNFVADDVSIHDKTAERIQSQIAASFNSTSQADRPVASGHLYLTEAELAEFAPHLEGDEFVLPADVVKARIFPRLFGGLPGQASNDFLMDHPIARLCVRNLDIPAAADSTNPSSEDGAGTAGSGTAASPGDDEPPAAVPDDVFKYVGRQMEHVSSPEGLVTYGVDGKGRATAAQIGDNVDQLTLRKGPADSPAYFDFHTLSIAFEHVWKEATDAGIIQAGEALYDQVVGTGQQPTNLNVLIANLQSTIRFLKSDPQQERSTPPVEVIFEFPDAVNVWTKMTTPEQNALTKIADAILGKYESGDSTTGVWKKYLLTPNAAVPYIDKSHLIDRGAIEAIGIFRQKGRALIETVTERVEEADEVRSVFDQYQQAASLATDLLNQLKQRYSFTYFAANAVERSINFGVLLTYRQKWDPIAYQAGELVRTLPLAPKEVRKYSKRTVVKKSRSEKEVEDNLRVMKTDTSDTSRAESQIVDRALNKTSFSLNTQSTIEIPLSDKIKIGSTITTNQKADAEKESNQTKKDFRESVIKAAQEYRNERKIEISTDSSFESETTESGEVTNPNDELTVTYLFYELQRQFRINERLHRLRPVILVAQEMPAPHEIDDEWIVRHDWILKRVLLDDSFIPAFDCIMSVRGDELMLGELERSAADQRKIVRDLRQNVKYYTDETGRLSRLMQASINKEADITEDRDIWDGIPLLGTKLDAVEGAIKGVGSLLGMGKGDDPKEAARIRREGVKDAFERADRERRELLGRLERETGVMSNLSHQVAEGRKAINEKAVLIARLKAHLKDNILHYMQAIWSYEKPDQRFFRLFGTKVVQPVAAAGAYNLRIQKVAVSATALDQVVNLRLDGDQRKSRHVYTMTPVLSLQSKTLEEVAEVDNLLGFKGNYMIFPLKQSNALTDFMMAPYVDSEFGLLDPDAPGNWSIDDFDHFYGCLKREMGDKFGEIEGQLKEFFQQILMDPLRPGEIITVPTGSLFIEALPGEHPILEDFKALHRAIDVKKAQAEVRKLELENARYASRILKGETDDPDIDRKIVVEGNPSIVVDPDPS